MSDDFMLTAEELRLRQLKRRRITIAVIALLLLLGLGLIAGRPARNAIKGWQARRHAEKGFAFIAQEKWTDARNEVTAAYQLRQNEPQALRAVARFLSRTRQREALDFWQQLGKIDKLTPEDLRDEATVALIAGETDQAEAALQPLRERKDAGPADWLLDAQLSIQKGEVDNAFALLGKILGAANATEPQQFQAALLERSLAVGLEGASDRVSDAWSHLQKLAQGTSETALNALVVLAQRELESRKLEDRDQKTEDREQRSDVDLARALELHPRAKAPHKLLALDLKEHVDLARRGENIEQAIAQWKDADATELLALATWLNGKGEYQRMLDTVPLEKALKTRELFLQRLDAFGALGRWIDIKQLLEAERFPLDPVVQRMYLARCNAQLGEKTAAENNWKRALEEAGGEPGKLMMFAEYAEKNGNLPLAEAAYSTALVQAPKLRVAFQGKLRVAQASGDTKRIHDVLAEMLRVWPNDASILNDEAYTRLLLMASPQRTEVRGQRSEAGDRGSEISGQTSGKQTVEAAVPAARSNPNAGDSPSRTGVPATTGKVESEKSKGEKGEATEGPHLNPLPGGEETAKTKEMADEELNPIVDLAEKLVKKNPRSLPHRTLLALARLRQNRADDALAVYSNVQVSPNALTPSALAVHAAVLNATGHVDDARTEIAQLARNRLLPEERALLPQEEATEDIR